jgi:hypothetical protein
MKKQFLFLIRTNVFLLFLLLIGSSLSKAAGPGDAEKSFGIFINGKRLRTEADSLAINAKGTLTLHALVGELPMDERIKFKVWIFHRVYAGKMLLFPWKEAYRNAEPSETVDLSKILLKTKGGDQLILIPENSHDEIQITVTGGNC